MLGRRRYVPQRWCVDYHHISYQRSSCHMWWSIFGLDVQKFLCDMKAMRITPKLELSQNTPPFQRGKDARLVSRKTVQDQGLGFRLSRAPRWSSVSVVWIS